MAISLKDGQINPTRNTTFSTRLSRTRLRNIF